MSMSCTLTLSSVSLYGTRGFHRAVCGLERYLQIPWAGFARTVEACLRYLCYLAICLILRSHVILSRWMCSSCFSDYVFDSRVVIYVIFCRSLCVQCFVCCVKYL